MNDMAGKLITIGIRRYLVTQPRTKRTRKAAKYIRERISHYMKIDLDKVKFSKELNDMITARAQRMKPVKLNIEIDKGIATATLFKEQAVQLSATKTAAQKKQPAKVESTAQAKGATQAATKEKPASARKSPERAAENTNMESTVKSPEKESRKADRNENPRK